MAVLMTSKEVCDYLGIKVNNLYQIQFRGHIKAVSKEGKHSFYAQQDVEAFKAKRDAKGK
jgi:predicted site-specific integrase-resolvase